MQKKIKRSRADQCVQLLIDLFVILLCAVIVLPCLNVLALAFNDGADAAKGGVWFWPRVFTLDNFKEVFKDDSIVRAYGITIARTVIGTISKLIVTTMAAFALMDKGLPGRKTITIAITFTMLFSGGTIPTYIQYHDLGLTGTFWVYIIPSLCSVTHLMMLRTFMEGIPESLVESAQLDGCGFFKILCRIMLPLMKPVIAVVALYTAVDHWNDWFAGSFYQTDKAMWPVQTLLQQMLTRINSITSSSQLADMSVSQLITQTASRVTSDSLKMATVVVTTVPILCIYPFAQKYFAKGAMIGAVKG